MYFDFAMPLTLFAVTLLTLFLSGKTEDKLKNVLEERQIGLWSAMLLAATITMIVLFIVFIPQMMLVNMFLFSYSALLFIFAYLHSDMQRLKAQIFCIAFLIFTFSAGTLSLLVLGKATAVCATSTFFGLFAFTFLILLYEELRVDFGRRWYLAVLPPALFLSLYIFFSKTIFWMFYLANVCGIVSAVLATLFIGNLFTWKPTLFFAGIVTIMDIILVLITGTMSSAAEQALNLRLPVAVLLPTLPFSNSYILLGLGDFFFAGLLATQTLKKYGKKSAVQSTIAMTISFFTFEAFLPIFGLSAFPGTVMIICGWLLFVLWKNLKKNEI
ncbi:MAG: hypothetical protein QW270_01085 [Candidatus Bathyarchaeia archaeon]